MGSGSSYQSGSSNKISNSAKKGGGGGGGGATCTAPPERQILTVVRPFGQLCRLFGVFPFTFVTLEDSLHLQYRQWVWFILSLVILLVTSGYLIFQLGSFLHCLAIRGILQLTAQSIWTISVLPSYFLSIFMLVRGAAVVQLFEDWARIERDLERLFCPIMTRRHVLRFERIYGVMTCLSVILVGYHAYQRPTVPVYPFYYMDTFSTEAHLAWVAFQMVIVAWMWAGLGILEGICCLFSTVISQCMSTLETGLVVTFNNGKKSQDSYTEQPQEPNLDPKNHDEFMQTAVHSILAKMSKDNEDSAGNGGGGDDPNKGQGPFKSEAVSKIHKEDYLIFVVRKLQTVGSLQGKVNRILGPLLLLDVAQLVIMTCIMIFLPLRYSHKLGGFEIGVTFLGNGAAVMVRLILFVVSLGSVYTKGQEVNMALAQALISAKLATSCQNPVLAHLSVYSSNPITFTAWDFFPITRGTLLAAFSLISTYAIVFLQINF